MNGTIRLLRSKGEKSHMGQASGKTKMEKISKCDIFCRHPSDLLMYNPYSVCLSICLGFFASVFLGSGSKRDDVPKDTGDSGDLGNPVRLYVPRPPTPLEGQRASEGLRELQRPGKA